MNLRFLYLESQIIWALIFVAILLIVSKKGRRLMFISALVSLPLAFLSIYLFKEVWSPQRILPFPIGIEDFLFTFLSAGIAVGSLWIFRTPDYEIKILNPNFCRLIGLGAFGITFLIILKCFGLNGYPNVFLVMSFMILYIGYRQPELIRLFVRSGLVCGVIYFLGLVAAFRFWPRLASFWNVENISEYYLFEVPIEEMIWAILFCGCWSMIFHFVYHLRLK